MTGAAPKRVRAERQGRKGEAAAAMYLRAKGWRILAERVRNPAGEIDLVARRGSMVIFVEVKWRARADDLNLAIDARRLARVCAAAEVEAHKYLREGDDMRIDVLLLAPGRLPRHLANAGQF
ncbi:YraN family protein [Croceicoccus bisphenolivorans]|uniref:YraN family protein n=1 Tax=Croceicoccus bisphenolivorans TaxID=1783232 RepID=UPI00248157A4|nr:YraN family protein [Croceicoccus bisphenolivorans]